MENNESNVRKDKTAMSKKTKWLIGGGIAIVIIAILVILAVNLLAPVYHYNTAMNLIEKEDYREAYLHLKQCQDYKDTKEQLKHFSIVSGKTVTTSYENGIAAGHIEHEVNQDGKTTLYISYDADNKVNYGYKYEFDSHGNETKTTHLRKDGTETVYKYEYTYDQNDNITEKICYGPNGEVTSRFTFEYDQSGNMLVNNAYGANGKFSWKAEYTYDSNGNNTEIVMTDADGKLSTRTQYQYNQDGKIVKYRSETFDTLNAAGTNTHIFEEEYSANGKLINHVEYDANGQVASKIEYEYDSNGNLIKKTEFDADGAVTRCFEAKYNEDNMPTEVSDEHTDKSGHKIAASYEIHYENGQLVSMSAYENDALKCKAEVSYDKDGFVTKVTTCDQDGNLTKKLEFSNPIALYNAEADFTRYPLNLLEKLTF